MNTLDGVATAQHIRANWPARAPYLIALTADTVPGAPDRYHEAGFDDYLSKPVQLQQLAEALARIQLGTAQPAEDSKQPSTPPDGAPAAAPDRPIDTLLDLDPESTGDQTPIPPEWIYGYLDDAAALLATMHDAVARLDFIALQRAAHQLKSSSAIVTATRLVYLCETLEQATDLTPSSWPGQVQSIADELAQVKQTLTAHFPSH
jgi:HPt (histidine-containing phosphotransfer) domain-containing protein